MFSLDPPPGFQGLCEELPIRKYQRNLPHWRQDGATYFVTFGLNDSIPQPRQQLLRDLKTHWLRENPPPHSQEKLAELARIIGEESEKWLDAGLGSCRMRVEDFRGVVRDALEFFDTANSENRTPRYELGAAVVMPNHIHAIVRPLDEKRWSLEDICKSWKRHSAQEINRIRGVEGAIWFQESYDRIVRDREHLWQCLQYIGRNGSRAGLKPHEFCRWVRTDWVELGWGFEE